jgi:glycosyltransferase involved in cell wall biosynthesis
VKILWVNTGRADTMSNTRLYGIPPVLEKLGDKNFVLIAGRSHTAKLPPYFLPLPILLGKLGAYRLLVALLLPFLCWKHCPQVVLTDWTSARLTKGLVLLRRLGLLRMKLVHDVRTVPVKEDAGKSWAVYAGALNYAKRHFDGLTTITEPLREEICGKFHIPSEKMAVWTSGVDIAHFHPQEAGDLRRQLGLEGKFVVFYHGSVNANRGLPELVQATRHLADLPDIRLLVVGGGNEWENLQNQVRTEGLSKVILKDSVPYDQIPRWISCADLCAVPLPDHPWWRVSSPLKLMEYLAMGKPVVLTELNAHRAILPSEEEAFYVPHCTAEDFAAGIRRAWAQKDRFAGLGTRGRRQAEKELTWERQAMILREYLQNVVEGKIVLREGLS